MPAASRESPDISPFASNAGTNTIRAGNITTDGSGSVGILATGKGGNIDITAGGAIHSAGDGINTDNGTFVGAVTTTCHRQHCHQRRDRQRYQRIQRQRIRSLASH
jgi:hypothetical protein